MTEVITPIGLLRRLQDGSLAPKALHIDERTICVEHLLGDGMPIGQMAELFQVSPRTVDRDIRAIRTRNAVERSDETTAKFVGGYDMLTEQAISRLSQIARDSSQPGQTRVEANRTIVEAAHKRIMVLQSLGILPKAAHEIRADMTHSFHQETPEDILRELNAIREIGKVVDLPPAIADAADVLEAEVVESEREKAHGK